jgi:hypothetical protein
MVQESGTTKVAVDTIEADDSGTRDGEATTTSRFRQAVRGMYPSSKAAWEAFGKVEDISNGLSRSGFKLVLSLLNLSVSKSEQKKIRRTLDPQNTKKVQYETFVLFMEGAGTEVSVRATLPPLPMNLPQLPEGFCRRSDLEDKIIELLLSDHKGGMTSCILAKGMGVRYVVFLIPDF